MQVAHDEVGPAGGDDVDRPLGVVGLADHVEGVAELGAQPGANDGMVVGEHDADGSQRASSTTRTSVPPPSVLSTSDRPPIDPSSPVDRLGQTVSTRRRGRIEAAPVVAHAGEHLPIVVGLGEHDDRAGAGVLEGVGDGLADRPGEQVLLVAGRAGSRRRRTLTLIRGASTAGTATRRRACSTAWSTRPRRSSPADPAPPNRNARRSWSASRAAPASSGSLAAVAPLDEGERLQHGVVEHPGDLVTRPPIGDLPLGTPQQHRQPSEHRAARGVEQADGDERHDVLRVVRLRSR